MGYDFLVSNTTTALPHRATLVREDKERVTWLSTDSAPEISVRTLSTKFNGDCRGHLKEYGMVPQVYNRMVQQLGSEKPETEVFASRDPPQLRKCTRYCYKGDSAWSRHWGLKEGGPMYRHGAQEDIKRMVNKIIADRAKGMLFMTGVLSSPCPLEDLKPTLDSKTLEEMQFVPEEQFSIVANCMTIPVPGQACSTKSIRLMSHGANPLVMRHSLRG